LCFALDGALSFSWRR